MAFFTSQQLFGNGAGVPGDAGWVPIDTSAPATFSANNRGVAFGEQLTSAIANRPHYALALNDDDLNTRLALFETGGLDTAYDLGAAAVDGGGRIIEKDGGAVETQSALAAMHGDDIMNAHFRANQIADVVRGGGGFESASYGRLGASALFGFLDRRAMNLAGSTVIADSEPATVSGNTITFTSGQLRDGSSNTHLMPGYDLIEILDGVDAGVYVLSTITGLNTCFVAYPDGAFPSFTAAAVNVRVFRPTFGTFSHYGQTGTNKHISTLITGLPGSEAALELVPGSTLGRYGTASASTDGSRYALRVRWKSLTGTISTKLDIDSQGQVRSYVGASQLTSAQLGAALEFGAPSFVTQHDGTTYDVGYLARNNGESSYWMGSAIYGESRPPSTPTGVFAFNFISTGGFNVDLTDVTAADWQITPGITLVEITSPTAQAGVYLVTARDPNTGQLTVSPIDSAGVTSFPVVGAGTLRILYGATFGQRLYDVGTSIFAGFAASGRAAAVIEGPKQTGGVALLLEAGNQNADPSEYHLIRSVVSEDGGHSEPFAVTSLGKVGGHSFQASASGEFSWKSGRSFTKALPLSAASPNRTDVTTWLFQGVRWEISTADASEHVLYIPLNGALPDGCTLTEFECYFSQAEATSAAARAELGYASSAGVWTSVSGAVVNLDSGTSPVSDPIASHVMDQTLRTYYVRVRCNASQAALFQLFLVNVTYEVTNIRI